MTHGTSPTKKDCKLELENQNADVCKTQCMLTEIEDLRKNYFSKDFDFDI